MKQAANKISSLEIDQIEQLTSGGSVDIDLNGKSIELTESDIEIVHQPREGLAVSTEGSLVVGIDTSLNKDLIQEGLAREFVNKIQNLRKEMDLEVTQRIEISLSSDAEVIQAIEKYKDYIKRETLSINIAEDDMLMVDEERSLNDHILKVKIKPLNSEK